jgi:hypothetical protein
MDLVYYPLNGVSYSAINCPNCDHRTPPEGTCPVCQPTPTMFRCATCEARGPIPTTTTIAPGQTNDPPSPTTIVSTPSGTNNPPGHNT